MTIDSNTNQDQTGSIRKAGDTAGAPVDVISVKIYSPFKIYFEGKAKSISAESATGPFDILPRHHNFITLLEPCDVRVVLPNGEDEAYSIQGGVMHVRSNDVVIFLDV